MLAVANLPLKSVGRMALHLNRAPRTWAREREDRLSISEDSRNMFTLCLALAVALTVNVAAGAGARPFSVLRAR